jgi:hypothetical protein
LKDPKHLPQLIGHNHDMPSISLHLVHWLFLFNMITINILFVFPTLFSFIFMYSLTYDEVVHVE